MKPNSATRIVRASLALQRLGELSRRARSGRELYQAVTGCLQACLSPQPDFPVRVTLYTFDGFGMLQVCHASDLKTLRGSHRRGTRLEDLLKETIARRGIFYLPNIRPGIQEAGVFCVGKETYPASIVLKTWVAAGYVRKFGENFGAEDRMDMAFGCLADGKRPFGAWKIDNFEAGRPLLEAGMEREEFLALALLASAGASNSMAEFYDRIRLEEERDAALHLQSGANFLLRYLTHAVNNRCLAMGGQADLMESGELNGSQLTRLRRLQGSLQQLRACVVETQAAMRSGQTMTVTKLPTDIRALVEDHIVLLEGKIVIDQDMPQVITDGNKILNILFELVTNAKKYSQPNSPIEMSVRNAGDEIVISVVDQGKGLLRREKQQIFNGGYRADASLPGTGWGLNTCKIIIENLGGRIWVESSGRGKGSTFRIALPVS